MADNYFDFYRVSFIGTRKMPMKRALKELGFDPKSPFFPIQSTQKWDGGRFPSVFHEATVKTFDVGGRGLEGASESASAFAKTLEARFPECRVSVTYHAVD